MNALVYTSNVKKIYRKGRKRLAALDGVDLRVEAGEFLAVTGPSGSGKSTLLNILGCLDRATSGIVQIDGWETGRMDARGLAALRRQVVGIVFQQHNLLPALTAAENVMLPMHYLGTGRRQAAQKAAALLERVGLADRANHLPAELSVGQQQRVAVARALANSPRLVLADEPTGSLDPRSSAEVIDLMRELNRSEGQTFIVVTHDLEVAARAGRQVRLDAGRIVSDTGRAFRFPGGVAAYRVDDLPEIPAQPH